MIQAEIRGGRTVVPITDPAQYYDGIFVVMDEHGWIEPDDARNLAFTLMDLADKIDPPKKAKEEKPEPEKVESKPK